MRSAFAVFLVLSLTACGITDFSPQSGPGESTTPQASTTAVTVSTSTTTLAPPTTRKAVESDVLLGADGLGLVVFGDPFHEVMDKLEGVLGPPTFAEDADPNSPSRTEFVAGWEKVGLTIGFSTYPIFSTDGELRFTRWSTFTTTPPVTPLRTQAGVRWGSTLNDLENTYGERFWVHSDECAPPGIIVPKGDPSGGSHDENGHPRWILVSFDQPELWNEEGQRYFQDPHSTRVVGMAAGASDGC